MRPVRSVKRREADLKCFVVMFEMWVCNTHNWTRIFKSYWLKLPIVFFCVLNAAIVRLHLEKKWKRALTMSWHQSKSPNANNKRQRSPRNKKRNERESQIWRQTESRIKVGALRAREDQRTGTRTPDGIRRTNEEGRKNRNRNDTEKGLESKQRQKEESKRRHPTK